MSVFFNPSKDSLQSCWRDSYHNGTELDYDFYLCSSSSTYSEKVEKVKEILNQHIDNEQKINLLQDEAFDFFSGYSSICMHLMHKTILNFIFYASSPDPSDIASVLLKAEAETLKKSLPRAIDCSRILSSWVDGKTDVDPEEQIEVSFGGGRAFFSKIYFRSR